MIASINWDTTTILTVILGPLCLGLFLVVLAQWQRINEYKNDAETFRRMADQLENELRERRSTKIEVDLKHLKKSTTRLIKTIHSMKGVFDPKPLKTKSILPEHLKVVFLGEDLKIEEKPPPASDSKKGWYK